jgi:hypothetical protein
MTFRARHLALLVPLLLTGCIFHKKQAQPVQVLAPPASSVPKPEPEHPKLSDSDTTIPAQPIKDTVDANLPAKPLSHHHRSSSKPTQQAASVPPAAPPPEPPAVSAIGQLSTGEPADLRHAVEDSISSTERGLSNIGRSLNDQEQKTASQIREFLKQAKEALNNNDIDGAKTLVSKAKVLLSELNQ